MNKRLTSMIICGVMLFCFTSVLFTGCGDDDGSGYTFRINLAENPENLDPQLATDESSIAVISNMYDGLLRKAEDGSISPAAAESYEVSEDKLTYTFKLKRNIYWQSVTKYKAVMKADDFVFAFQRIFDPQAQYSPYTQDFICIKNSYAVMTGKADVSALGVSATDDYTLEIKLEKPCWDFPERLTSTGALPCNRLFFESTKGRYGLSADSCISNGAFYMKEWNYDPYWKDNYIIMRRNKSNSENDLVYPYSINFFITDDETRDKSDFSSGSVDVLISGSYDDKLMKKNSVQTFHTSAYGLLINVNSQYLSDKEMRRALAYSVNRGQLYNNEAFSPAGGIIPDAVSLADRSYRSIVPDEKLYTYDLRGAKKLWNDRIAANSIPSVDGVSITVPEDFDAADSLKTITSQWQNELDFYCGLDVVSMKEYDMIVSDRSFDILLVKISAEQNNPQSFLSYFTDGTAESISGYSNNQLNTMVYAAANAENEKEAAEKFYAAEKLILDDYVFIPLYYGSTFMVYSEKTDDLVYYPFENIVYFRYGKKFD